MHEIFGLYFTKTDIRFCIQKSAQHCFAADAAGAAPGLGAIFVCRAVPPAVPVHTLASGAAESWRWAAKAVLK